MGIHMRSRALFAGAVLSCALVSGGWLVTRGLVGTRPGMLLADEQRDDLELGPHRRRHTPSLNRSLHLAHGASEHRDHVLGRAHSTLLPRRGVASARLALA